MAKVEIGIEEVEMHARTLGPFTSRVGRTWYIVNELIKKGAPIKIRPGTNRLLALEDKDVIELQTTTREFNPKNHTLVYTWGSNGRRRAMKGEEKLDMWAFEAARDHGLTGDGYEDERGWKIEVLTHHKGTRYRANYTWSKFPLKNHVYDVVAQMAAKVKKMVEQAKKRKKR